MLFSAVLHILDWNYILEGRTGGGWCGPWFWFCKVNTPCVGTESEAWVIMSVVMVFHIFNQPIYFNIRQGYA